jgi:hypothetical protein
LRTSRLTDFIEERFSALPRWLKLGLCLALVLGGLGWAWVVGRSGLHQDVAKLGFIAIAVGTVGFALVILSDDNGYNF